MEYYTVDSYVLLALPHEQDGEKFSISNKAGKFMIAFYVENILQTLSYRSWLGLNLKKTYKEPILYK